MTAAPISTAPPSRQPVRLPTPPATRRASWPPLPHDGKRAGVGRAHGEPTTLSRIDPLRWRVGLLALIVAAGVASTVYLLLRLLMPAVVTEPGLWSIAAEVRHIMTALFRYF